MSKNPYSVKASTTLSDLEKSKKAYLKTNSEVETNRFMDKYAALDTNTKKKIFDYLEENSLLNSSDSTLEPEDKEDGFNDLFQKFEMWGALHNSDSYATYDGGYYGKTEVIFFLTEDGVREYVEDIIKGTDESEDTALRYLRDVAGDNYEKIYEQWGMDITEADGMKVSLIKKNGLDKMASIVGMVKEAAGTGLGNYRRGKVLTDVKAVQAGQLLVFESHIFKAVNLVKVTETFADKFYGIFVKPDNPIEKSKASDEEFSVKADELEKGEWHIALEPAPSDVQPEVESAGEGGGSVPAEIMPVEEPSEAPAEEPAPVAEAVEQEVKEEAEVPMEKTEASLKTAIKVYVKVTADGTLEDMESKAEKKGMDLQLVTDSQNVAEVKDYFGNDPELEDFDGFFVNIEDGDYADVYGFKGEIPDLYKTVYRVERVFEPEASKKTASVWEVTVGNVGNISCKDETEARERYKEYIDQSKSGVGRAADESVCLMKDGEPVEEYRGTLESEASKKTTAVAQGFTGVSVYRNDKRLDYGEKPKEGCVEATADKYCDGFEQEYNAFKEGAVAVEALLRSNDLTLTELDPQTKNTLLSIAKKDVLSNIDLETLDMISDSYIGILASTVKKAWGEEPASICYPKDNAAEPLRKEDLITDDETELTNYASYNRQSATAPDSEEEDVEEPEPVREPEYELVNHEPESDEEAEDFFDTTEAITIGEDDKTAYYAGREICEVDDPQFLPDEIHEWMEKNKYWPNVIGFSDHGNPFCYSVEKIGSLGVDKASIEGLGFVGSKESGVMSTLLSGIDTIASAPGGEGDDGSAYDLVDDRNTTGVDENMVEATVEEYLNGKATSFASLEDFAGFVEDVYGIKNAAKQIENAWHSDDAQAIVSFIKQNAVKDAFKR